MFNVSLGAKRLTICTYDGHLFDICYFDELERAIQVNQVGITTLNGLIEHIKLGLEKGLGVHIESETTPAFRDRVLRRPIRFYPHSRISAAISGMHGACTTLLT